ncbi:LOW QUALITY PROTEIN: IQ domain-containing protein N [Callospermophilus lateralis]|uniref:LOW QUALITY PROTEIN: IQ domain-containing protein N n=1 Tax=Callospermophilus lateralis TaxID=76772 RepID=UPI0040543F47
MTLQGPSDLLRNQDDAAGRTAPVHEPVVTEWAVHPPAPAHPCLPDKVGRASAQQYEARKSKEQLLQQPAQSKTEPRRIPRLRAVVESQAFKNILVDEMDMMLSRAATLIQANWRGYRLRQKLISQMLAAKAIQEAWRRFNTRRLLRSSKVTVKRVSKEEGDIPYHPPQQVRFQPPEDKPLQMQPVMMSKETQFPSSDSLVTCIPQLGLLQHPAAQGMAGPGMQAPHGPGAHGVAFLPHQTIAMRLPSPVSLDPKCQPCLLTKTVRSSCLIRHLEGDTVKTKHVTTRATKAGAPEPPPSGRYGQTVPGTFKAQIQAHVEADIHKTPPQAFPASTPSKTPPKTSPLVSITRTQAQVSPISTATKTPPQTGPGPIMTVMKTLAQTGPSPTVTRTQAQMRQTPSLTNAPLQSRLAATMAKIPPQVCLLASVMRPPCPARPGATTARPPPQTCPVSAVTKPSPQIRLVTAPTKNQMPTCQAATVTKTPSQVCPGASIMKPPPQTRLAAMITKTPAQIRSVAAVLRTLCLVPPVVGNLRTPPQTAAGSAGIPSACSTMHLNAQKGKVMVNVRQTAGVKDSSHSYLAEGKVRGVPQPHLEAGAPKPMARGPLEPEKVRTGLQRQVKKETVSKTNMTMEMTQPLPWTKVAEDRNKSPPQAQQRIELIKVQSQVYVPVEAAAALPRTQTAAPLTKTLCQARPSPRQAKVLPQEQLTTPLTKTLTQLHPATEQAKALSQQVHLATCPPTAMPQPHLATCLTKTTSQVHLTSEQTKVLSQGHLSTTLAKTLPQPPLAASPTTASPLHSPAKQTKAVPQAPQSPKTPSQVYPPSRLTKTPSLAHLVTCLTKAQSQVHLSSGAVKIQSQAQLPVGLTKTQSQAQLVSQTKSFYTARQSTDLNSKTQSQPLLTGSRASAASCQHLGAMSFLSRPKSEDRPAQLQPQGHVQSKTTHGPCPVASEAQGMLVPLMTSTGHPTCNIEPWGDSGTARAQPPVASQAVPCQEAAASQIASLCAELAAVLGSQEDIRALLAKALSQGEVRAALNQALSKDVLGTTVTKAMPQGMLGMALVKALSWGELGITLSRALSRGELRSELTKVMQGKLAEVLSKALTDEERAALGQALCQGELGAVLSQSLSQAALRTAAILPKASSKAVGSGMTLLPASVEVDCRGNASAAWGSAVGPGRPQPSKGPAAAGMLLSLSQGATPAGLARSMFQKNMVPSMGPSQCQVTDGLVPMASQVLERGVSLTHGETSMASGMDPSRPRVALPGRLGTSQDPLSMFHLGLRTSQATVPLPVPLDHQLPAMPTAVPSSYPYARIVPEDAVMGTASGSLASRSADRRLTPAMVPNAVANFMACSLSRGSVIRGMGQSLPRGSMVTGMAQSRLLDPTASGVAHSLPPGTGAGRVAPHQMAALGTKGKRLDLAMGPLARFTAPSLSPGSVARGVGPSVPLGSVKTGGQSPPQGSMLIGLTPRPYHGAGEGPAALLQAAQAAQAAGLAQVHPQASGAQGTTRGQHRVPTVLSRASPFIQDPRILTPGTIEDPTKLKPRDLGEALAQESGSDRESNKSKVLEVTPWMCQSPRDNYVETPPGPPRAEETLPKGQMSLLGERAPGQASGMAPVPFRARHSMTSSFSTSLQPDSVSPRGPPGTYLLTTSRARSLQLGTAVDRAMPQPLTPVVSDDFSALQPESMTHMRPPSQGSLASDIVLISPHLASPVASSVYAGSAARTESSGVLQRSGAGHVAPHGQPYQSKAVPGHSQMAPVPSAFQKPVSGNLTQTSLKSLRPKKYYRLIHGKLIPELLEGSMTTVVPSNQVQRQETQSPLGSRRHSPCELWVGRSPTVQPSDTAFGSSVTRLSPGVRRVSLGYTTSPSGLWRPLLEQDSQESVHLVTRHHKPFPTPSVHQGQISRHAVGPVAGLHKPPLVPTVLQGPVDAGLASAVPSVAVRPMDHAVAPQSMWETARGPVPWDTLGSVAAVSPRQPGELMVSVQTMEKILVRAAVVIQAFARGYLVRSTIRVWHQCATVIQASWRGFRVRRNLARLYRATTIIQAAWRGYCTRRDCAQQMLLPAVWVELGSKVRAAPDPRSFPGSEARLGSDHRCFQSCQPHICSLCQSLSPGLGNPPSVVMLVGSSPRTCHMCGHTLPTRVVHGMGRSISSQGGLLWACSSPRASQGLCRSPGQNRAAMAIQSAWRGFKTRRQLRQQQSAAKMVQSNWRGHYTRSCLTTDMLLGSGAPRDCSRDPSRHSTHSTRSARWPGV